jgi:hypothetical protein
MLGGVNAAAATVERNGVCAGSTPKVRETKPDRETVAHGEQLFLRRPDRVEDDAAEPQLASMLNDGPRSPADDGFDVVGC